MVKIDALAFAMAVACLLIFVVGMIGVQSYADSKLKQKISRLNFSSAVGYGLGLAPLFYFIGSQYGSLIDQSMINKFFVFSTLLTWILCIVLISDANNNKRFMSDETYRFIVGMAITSFILFVGFAYFSVNEMTRRVETNSGNQLKFPYVYRHKFY
jgi:hypothetical protein